LPFTATSFGSWHGTDPKKKKQTDIDVIAANRKTKQIIFCECKWTNEINVLQEAGRLKELDRILTEYTERYYYIFCKAKPKEECDGVTVITADMLFGL